MGETRFAIRRVWAFFHMMGLGFTFESMVAEMKTERPVVTVPNHASCVVFDRKGLMEKSV